jgi:hypothetical protein
MSLKSSVISSCFAMLEEKIADLSQQIADIQQSMTSETKSSVGDKHETARARMQSEESSLQQQLADAKSGLADLKRLAATNAPQHIAPGSLVRTENGIFYIGVALGKVKISNETVYMISPLSPLGAVMSGKRAGDSFVMAGRSYTITAIE